MGDLLTKLESGMSIVYGGNRVVTVSEQLAKAFADGDRLVVVQDTGDLLHIPETAWSVATAAVDSAVEAFGAMGGVEDDQIAAFYTGFADRLADDDLFGLVSVANAKDVKRAQDRGRSTTRLLLSARMRQDMIDGLRSWALAPAGRGEVVETKVHDGWSLEQVRAGLGVVAFVFEGRPNVMADATGVLRSGNTVVFRIGSDALATARAVMELALKPALIEAGLPEGAVSLIDASSRAAGWAMFSDSRISLAVGRGSGAAVSQLGSVARQAGTPVSLHGTGGAWIVASESADVDHFTSAVYHSLDRKVCNTLNTVCIVASRADELVPALLETLERSGTRLGTTTKLHVTEVARPLIPNQWLEEVTINRADGPRIEPQTDVISGDELGFEWEWETSPEVTLTIVDDVAEAVDLFNEQSPRLVASLISDEKAEHERFFQAIDAPFVGNGFTRWVDGQYALDTPELGLSNWQFGRLFARGGIVSGDSVYTIRTRVTQDDPDLGR